MRRQTILAILVSIFAASAAYGQVKGPSKVVAEVGKLTAVPLTVVGDQIKYEILGSNVMGAFREFTPPSEIRFQVLGYKPGVGYITIAALDGVNLTLFTVEVKVVGVGPAPVPVPPDPVPVPPDPTPPADPLVAAIKATGTPPATLRLIADAMTACVGVTSSGRTASTNQEARKKTLVTGIPNGVPVKLHPILAAEMKAADAILPPSDPEHIVTDAERDKIRAIYTKLAAALTEAAK